MESEKIRGKKIDKKEDEILRKKLHNEITEKYAKLLKKILNNEITDACEKNREKNILKKDNAQ